jgi:hypothetical protein
MVQTLAPVFSKNVGVAGKNRAVLDLSLGVLEGYAPEKMAH